MNTREDSCRNLSASAKLSPTGYKPLLAIEQYLHQSDLGVKLIDLIKLRASQINGCASCIDMHWKDLRAQGECAQRAYMVATPGTKASATPIANVPR